MSLTVYADFNSAPLPKLDLVVVGLGYIGLPTAAALARAGHRVVGVDVNPDVVEAVNLARPHLVEPGLEELLAEVVEKKALSARTDMPEAEAYLIAVPTPVGSDQFRTPDLGYVFAAADAIAARLRSGCLVVLESTSPVGTTRKMIERMKRARPDLRFPVPGEDADADIDVVYSPERVIPGKTLSELTSNARVLGGVTPRAAVRAARIYRSLTTGDLLLTDDRSAEMVKLVENAFRDVNIAFANELSLICDRMEMNVWEVIALANHHPRVDILKPGPGVGGHCIAVDPWFIVAQAPEQSRLIRTAREVNDGKPWFVMDQVKALLDQNPGARAACFGLTFKPDVDDFRESPSLEIARALSRAYPGRLVCVDPYMDFLADPDGLLFTSLDEAMDCDVVVGLVAHSEFRRAERPKGQIIDACGLWS
jgi:UDP-N-acetyl-D-mannosaminuronic acid dehydrogenase